jgi:hypothetical protein
MAEARMLIARPPIEQLEAVFQSKGTRRTIVHPSLHGARTRHDPDLVMT